MIIKLLEQPIIAINEAEIAGTVDGVVIKDNMVISIYHRNMENYFAIPVENTIIGIDAVMIQDVTAMTLASQNVKSLKSMLDVYNTGGKHLGCLQGIEVDDELVVQYIYTEEHRIEISKIVNYESVIVVDEEDELEARSRGAEAVEQQVEAEKAEADSSIEIERKIKWAIDDHLPQENNPVNSELSVVRAMHQDEEKADIPGVDEKYAYLCGKQLLEGIDIDDTFYDKGTIIDADLINHAIGNNAIVTVIVNAEE